MTPEDDRLVAALVILSGQLPLLIDEITAGLFDTDERREFARVLATISADLVSGMQPRIGSPVAMELQAEAGDVLSTRSRVDGA